MLRHFSHVWFFATPWTAAQQAPLSMGCSKQECWSGLPFPPSGDLLDPITEFTSLTSPAPAGRFFITRVTWVFLRNVQSFTPKSMHSPPGPPITWHFRPRSTWHLPATEGKRAWSCHPRGTLPREPRTEKGVHEVSAPAVAAVCEQLSGGGVAGHWDWLV